MKIIVATRNRGKFREFEDLFNPYDIDVESLDAHPELPEVEETGHTFAENALIKAKSIAELTDTMVIADDSGLVVPALNGAPGIYSARYSGPEHNDERNNQKLLSEMSSLKGEERAAYFVSNIAVVHPSGKSMVVEGKVEGTILTHPEGADGFGYDPLFYIADYECTFAQMPLAQKNAISHRAQAMKELMKRWPQWIKEMKR